LIHQPGELLTLPGIVIVLGVIVCIIGVGISARAGILRTRSQNQGQDESVAAPNLKRTILGMFLAILSGLLAGCIAIGFSFSGDMIALAEGEPFSNETWRATIPVTMLMLMSGCIPCCIYCAYKLTVNKTWGHFATPSGKVVILIALAMAVIHDSAVVLYGMGASYLGPLGVSLGYAVFMAFGIIFGNINGFITGEWKGASRQSIQMMICAILVLILASGVMGLAKALQN
jgi:L-rhamnose-H+ transport protein